MMDLHLSDEQADPLLAELDRIIADDRYFLSPRIQALREIRAALCRPHRPRNNALVRCMRLIEANLAAGKAAFAQVAIYSQAA